MGIKNQIIESYRNFRVRMNPLYVLDKPNLPTSLYLKAMGLTHDYKKVPEKILSRSLFENMTAHFPSKTCIRIQCSIIKEFPKLIPFMSFIDAEPCLYAADINPEKIKDMSMVPSVQKELYEKDHRLLDYIREPFPALQSAAIADDWENVYKFENLSREGLLSFMSGTLGIGKQEAISSCDTDMKTSFISQKYNIEWDKLERGVLSLLIKWKGIESDYVSNNIELLPEKEREILRNSGSKAISELLRDDIYTQRYCDSILEFKRETGLMVGEEVLEKLKPVNDKDMYRLHGIKKAMTSPETEARSYNEVVHDCVREEITRKRTRLSNHAFDLPKDYKKVVPGELSQILREVSERGDEGVKACKDLLIRLNLSPAIYSRELHDELIMTLSEWKSIESTGCVSGDRMPLDMEYITSLGYDDYSKEFEKALYKESYKATIEDLRSAVPGILLPENSEIVYGKGFKDDDLRTEGICEGIKMKEVKNEGTISDIYLSARENAIKVVTKNKPLESVIFSTKEIVSLRNTIRELDPLGDVHDLTKEQMNMLAHGKGINISDKGQIFRQKTIYGYDFSCVKSRDLSVVKDFGCEL